MIIKNGTGSGEYAAEVNQKNRLQVCSVSEAKVAYISNVDGNTFNFGTGIKTLADVDIWLLVAVIKNVDSLQKLRVWNLNIGWSGGPNKNEHLEYKWVVGLTPTANYIQYTPVNMNFASTKTPNVEGYIWDGVGTGITYTGADNGAEHILSVGRNAIDLQGIPIVGFNNSVGILIRSAEIGKYSIGSQFYMQSNNE